MANINRNIYSLYIIKIAKWFMLYMPVIVLFYEANGLDMTEVMTLQGIYSVAIVILEIPSGFFADVWGRKSTMIIGSILGVIGFSIYSFSYGFWGFLMAELTLGIGQSFISGSDSALLYDTLLNNKREKEYVKIEGRVISMGNFAEAIAAICGGLLAEFSLRTPFIAQIFVMAIAVPAAFILIEPKINSIRQKASIKSFLKAIKYAIYDNKALMWNIIFSAFIGASTLTMAWLVQPYLKNLNFSILTIGIIWSLLNLSVGLTSLFAYKIENRLGRFNTILLIIFFIAYCYIAIGYFHYTWVIIFFFLFYMIRGIATPVLKEYINQLTTSDKRATVLSVRNFVIRIIFAIIGPLVGWFSDLYSIHQALTISGIIFFVICIITFIGWISTEK